MMKISIIIAICSISIGLGWALYSLPVGHVSSDTFALSSQIQSLEKVTNEQRRRLLAHSQRIEEATDMYKMLDINHQIILKRSDSLQHALQLHDTVVADLAAQLASVSLQIENIRQMSETQEATKRQQHAQVGNLEAQLENVSNGLQRTATYLEKVTRDVASLREQIAWIVPQVESVSGLTREWKEAVLEWKEATKKASEAEATWLDLRHRMGVLEGQHQSLETLRSSVRVLALSKLLNSSLTWPHQNSCTQDCAQANLRVGRPDFALLSAGARVIPAWTTPTLQLTSRSWLSSLFHSPRFGNPPEVALQPDLHNGNCWPFAGQAGQLAISLARTISIQEVAIEHIPEHLSFDVSSAPMDMKLWGIEEGPLPSTWPSLKSEGRSDTNDPPKLPRGTSSLLIAHFRYDIAASNPIQVFPVLPDVDALQIHFKSVVLQIKNNWGNLDYTCLYGVHIHGTVVDGTL